MISVCNIKQKKKKQQLYKCLSVRVSVLSDSEAPWMVSLQAPVSMEFSRQEFWSG